MTTQLIALLTDRQALLAEIRRRVAKYSEDQPRDEHGRWTDGGGGSPGGSGWDLSSATHEIRWHESGTGRAVALRGGHVPESGPVFATTNEAVAANYVASRDNNVLLVLSFDQSVVPDVTSERWKTTESGKWADVLDLYDAQALITHPPSSFLEYLDSKGYAGFAIDGGREIRIENRERAQLKVHEPKKSIKFSEDQPRDEHGRWTDGGDSGSIGPVAEAHAKLDAMPRIRRADGVQMVANPIPPAPVAIQNDAEDGLLADRIAAGMKMGEYLDTYGTMETVNIELLTTEQPVVTVDGLKHFIDNPSESGSAPPPTAIQYGTHIVVRDGNTRISAAILRGETHVRVRTIYVDDSKRPAKQAQKHAVKFSEDQPRVPAGSPDGGQWTSGDGGSGGSSEASSSGGSFTVSSPSASDTKHDWKVAKDRAEALPKFELPGDYAKYFPESDLRQNPLPMHGEIVGELKSFTDSRADVEQALERNGGFGKLNGSAKIEQVRLDQLTSYQAYININQVKKYASNMGVLTNVAHDNSLATIVQLGGKNWIVDGNHRVNAATLGGMKVGPVKIINLEGK